MINMTIENQKTESQLAADGFLKVRLNDRNYLGKIAYPQRNMPHAQVEAYFEYNGHWSEVKNLQTRSDLFPLLTLRENRMEIAITILENTNDGNDLTNNELHIVECAVNDILNEEGWIRFKAIHDKTIKVPQ